MFKKLTPFYFFLMLSYIGILLSSLLISSLGSLITLSGVFLVTSTFSFITMIIDKRRGGISYMYEFFILFFIALPSFIQIKNQIFPWFAKFDVEHLSLAYALLSVSQIAFLSGIFVFQNILPAKHRHKKNIEISYISISRWAWTIALLSVIFAALAGPSNLVVTRFGREDAAFTGLTQQFLFMARSLSLLAFIMIIACTMRTPIKKIKRQNIFFGLAFLLPFLIINYPAALPRFILFGIIITLSTFFIDYFKPKTKFLVSTVSSSTLFLVFPIIKSLGHGTFEFENVGKQFSVEVIKEYILRVDFDAYMQLASTIKYLEIGGDYRFGKNFIGVLLFLVPRFIWENKPLPSGVLVAKTLGFDYTNVSSPLMAEALLGFGILGPIVVFFVFSLFISSIEFNLNRAINITSLSLSSIYYPICMAFITIILRGSINAVAAQFATAFIALFIIGFLNKYSIRLRE